MIFGSVNAQFEAIVALHLEDADGNSHQVDAAIDTGYTGFLTLPPATIAALALPWAYERKAVLADGSVARLDVYAIVVIWDGTPRKVDVDSVGDQPLIGMKMLAGYEVRICVVDGGRVWIDYVP